MNERLRELINTYEIKHGDAGLRKLAKSVNKTVKTLNRWRKLGVPFAHDAYTLAVECGSDEEEAVEIAKEISSEKATESA